MNEEYYSYDSMVNSTPFVGCSSCGSSLTKNGDKCSNWKCYRHWKSNEDYNRYLVFCNEIDYFKSVKSTIIMSNNDNYPASWSDLTKALDSSDPSSIQKAIISILVLGKPTRDVYDFLTKVLDLTCKYQFQTESILKH